MIETSSKTGDVKVYKNLDKKALPSSFSDNLKKLLRNHKDRHLNTYSWSELESHKKREVFFSEWIIRIETLCFGFVVFFFSALISIMLMSKQRMAIQFLYISILIKLFTFQFFGALREKPTLLIWSILLGLITYLLFSSFYLRPKTTNLKAIEDPK